VVIPVTRGARSAGCCSLRSKIASAGARPRSGRFEQIGLARASGGAQCHSGSAACARSGSTNRLCFGGSANSSSFGSVPSSQCITLRCWFHEYLPVYGKSFRRLRECHEDSGQDTSSSETLGIVVERLDQRAQLLEAVVSMHIAEAAGHALEMGDGAHWAVGENTVAVAMLVGAGDHIDMGTGRRVRSIAFFSQSASPCLPSDAGQNRRSRFIDARTTRFRRSPCWNSSQNESSCCGYWRPVRL
jgi:hypothetical protein